MTFTDFFRLATHTPQEPSGRAPYPYQERFAKADPLPHLLRAPTGAGKTATAVLGWLWRYFHGFKGKTPRRLVYCLPMRVLVEQSEREARQWIANLKLDVPVHVLMGGVDTEDWFLHPEKPAVLIGTQDMLLSRALNRGYAASRFHWPIDFGLLNNDCLWVFDEPQLMAGGVSTSAQLAGLRQALGTLGECPSVWMSATLEPGWLDTIDFVKGKFTAKAHELLADDYAEQKGIENKLLKRMKAEKTLRPLGVTVSKEADEKEVKALAKKILEKHTGGTQTLVIVNTVRRAVGVYKAINAVKPEAVTTLLVHSRFRPYERVGERDKDGTVIRSGLNDQLQAQGEATHNRILVATQVVEAGVDISSRTLVTELCPWASMVQRIGRCNRTGDDGPGQVYWIDLDEKLAAPYEAGELAHCRDRLTSELNGKDVSPQSLSVYRLDPTYPHKHVLRRRDLLDLFDTAPDLSGNDIDVSRFVRSDDPDTDVQVFWRADPPRNDWDAGERRRQAARRVELCNVPIGSFKDDFLKADKTAFRFDYLDGEWKDVTKKDVGTVIPGQKFWVTADQGGYDRDLGWAPKAGRLPAELLVELPNTPPKSRRERPEGFYDSDEWAQQAEWRTIAKHTDEVVSALEWMLRPDSNLPPTEGQRSLLRVAARWHDWGKWHPIFQSGIRGESIDPPTPRLGEWKGRTDIGKAPDEFWQKYRRTLADGRTPVAKRFRHELVSALGVLTFIDRNPPPDWAALPDTDRWLAVYLIAAHHGKVRLSIRAMPEESPLPPKADTKFACGVWDGDRIPTADLGGGVTPPETEVRLSAMELGGPGSWTAHALDLRDTLGPFRLAYLEALIRAADCRASAGTEGESDE